MNQPPKKSSAYLAPTMFDLKLLNFLFSIFINVVDPFRIIRRFIVQPATSKLIAIYEEYKALTLEKFDGSQSMILRVFVIFTIGFLLLCGAVLLYVLFYLLYMPEATHVKPVHMQYNKICDDETCDLQSMTSPFHTFPIAHLQLSRNQLMMVGQPYHIVVRLEVPETPRNQDLGVFMICVDMKDKENILKAHACRSTMLRYRSVWLQKLRTVMLIPFYVFGFREEKQDLNVEIFANYVDTTNSVTDIYVELQSKVVEFYGVSLHISAHFTGLRYIIFNFPIISAFFGISTFFVLLAIVTLLLWYHYDYEMDWVDETRRNYLGKSKSDMERKESSSISTTDEHPSKLSLEYKDDSDKLEDEDFMFDTSDGEKNKASSEE